MKTLQIVETAYRATFEEQDDTIVWLTHAMRGAGAELSMQLRANAVNYLVRAQSSEGLVIGYWRQANPPALAADLASLMAKGVPVYVVKEDMDERGIAEEATIPGAISVKQHEVASLIDRFDRVWHW